MTRTPSRIRTRRRLLLWSALPALLVTLLAVKLISVVVVGGAAQQHYASAEIGALADDVALLKVADIVEPSTTAFTAGGLAVLQDRLDVADAQFTTALAGTEEGRSCPVRVNLELVRERRGDIDAWEARLNDARQRYADALTVIAQAPPSCFSGNDDPDPQRRAVREDAAARIQAKIAALGTVAPLAPPSPPPAAEPVAPAAPPPAGVDEVAPDERRLDVGPDPLETLRQLLRDAAG